MHALILAAGHGTRLRPYTENRAKPSLPFLNFPLLGFTLFHLENSGLSKLTVNSHHAPKSIEQALTTLKKSHPQQRQKYSTHISNEQPKILGSGGAVKFAQPTLDKGTGAFIYANGDEVMLFDHSRSYMPLIETHGSGKDPIATLLLCKHPDVGTLFNGVWLDKDNQLVRFGKEDLNDHTTAYHFTGVMVLSERIFNYLPEGESHILHDGLISALNAGENVLGHIEENLTWFETGNPEGYLNAQAHCLESCKTDSMAAKTLNQILNRFTPESKISSGNSYTLLTDPETEGQIQSQKITLAGGVCIGAGTFLGSDVLLSNCSIETQCQIPPGTKVKNSIFIQTEKRF